MLEHINNGLKNPNKLINEINQENVEVLFYSYSQNHLNLLILKKSFDEKDAFAMIVKQWISILKERETYRSYDDVDLIYQIFLTSDFLDLKVSEENRFDDIFKDDIYVELYKGNISSTSVIENLDNASVFLINNDNKVEVYFGIYDDLVFMYRKSLEMPEKKICNNFYTRFLGQKDVISNIKNRPKLFVLMGNSWGAHNVLIYLIRRLIGNYEVKSLRIEALSSNFFRISGIREIKPIVSDGLDLEVIFALSKTFELKQNEIFFKGEKGEIICLEVLENPNEEFVLMFDFNKEILDFSKRISYYKLFEDIREFILLHHEEKIVLEDNENLNIIYPEEGLKTMLLENLNTSYLSWKNPMLMSFQIDNVFVEACFLLSDFNADVQKSYVNDIRTYGGGHHVEGLVLGVKRALEKYSQMICDSKRLKGNNIERLLLNIMQSQYGNEESLINEIRMRLNYVINVKMDAPQYKDAMKREFYNLELKPFIEEKVLEQLLNECRSLQTESVLL